MQELAVRDLLTTAGNAAFILLVLQLLVKPWLRPRLENGPYYPAAINTAAVGIGLLGSLIATAIPGINVEGAAQAVLVALGGAAVAIATYEVGRNVKTAVTMRRYK